MLSLDKDLGLIKGTSIPILLASFIINLLSVDIIVLSKYFDFFAEIKVCSISDLFLYLSIFFFF